MSLYYKAEEVEQSIFFHTADLLNLQVDLIFTVRPRPPFPLTRKMKVDSPPKKVRKGQKEVTLEPQVIVALAVTCVRGYLS